jgi:hypothetical protein
MNDSQLQGRIGWLSVILGGNRARLTDLLRRLRGVAASAGASLGLHKKFIHLLEQIQVEREKELDLIDEIEAVEKQHELRRKNKLLRQVSREGKCEAEQAGLRPRSKALEAEKEPSRTPAWKIIALFLLFSNFGKNNKNQQLNNE